MSINRKKKQKKKKSLGRFLLTLFKISIILFLLGIIVVGGTSLYLIQNALEDIEPINPSKINAQLLENSVILDSNGNELEKLQKGGARTLIKYNDMSPDLINAFVSTEDKTFFDHFGFNFIRMIGAIKEAVFDGGGVVGTSTISQQLARNLYLFDTRSDRTIDRKIQEAYYTLELEKYLVKEQIIEAYLNTIYLGSDSKGVQAASRKYFSKDASELDIYESAILAGIPKSPTSYAPMYSVRTENLTEESDIIAVANETYTFVYNSNIEHRYKIILYLLRENNYIDEAQYQYGLNLDLKSLLNPSIEKGTEITSYFSDMVEKEVINDLMETYGYSKTEATDYLYTGGLNIHSTIDFDMQKTLENAYSNNNFTDYYDQPTKNAVAAFQSKYGLSADGAAGAKTFSKLIELELIDEGEITSSVLSKGVKNLDVKILKEALNFAGLYSNNDLFPQITVYFDRNGNIINKDTNKILLFKYSNMINATNELFLTNTDFYLDDNGNLVLKKNEKLSFYGHYTDGELDRIQIVLKNTFQYDEGDEKNSRNSNGSYNISDLYSFQGRDLLVPNEYKSYDENKNVVISKEFLNSDENFFVFENDNVYISEESYVMSSTGTIQPQSAMIIIDYHTGHLKAVVGGRNVTGQKIYNRALNPRQPGSSVKPFAVYTPAIASRQYTAASVIDDVPTYLANDGSRWPKNWYETARSAFAYRGISTLREGIQQSMNVVTAKIANELGVEVCIDSMKNFGITTIVDEGSINDHNLSTVALGGMTHGIKPIELAQAYGTYGNDGVQLETITYTQVFDNHGNLILNNEPDKRVVISEDVNFIMRDILESAVTSGVASKAKIRDYNQGIPVAGKTGTTSNQYDAWFAGLTPYYVGVTWFGTDYNMSLDEGSSISAQFWSYVMKSIHEDLPDKEFASDYDVVKMKIDTKSGQLPSQLSYADPRNTVKTEYFLPGTQPNTLDDIHVTVEICAVSGAIATEYCPTTIVSSEVRTKRLDESYINEEHLYEEGHRSAGDIIPIRDNEYSVPTATCVFHGEEISIFDYENSSSETYFTFFPDNTAIIINPIEITLIDGQTILLPRRTKIFFNKDIILPDSSIIYASQILILPYYDNELNYFLNRNSTENMPNE